MNKPGDKNIISIIYGIPDTNTGGSALGISLLNLLKNHFKKFNFYYVSSHGDKTILENAYPMFSRYHPDVKIIPFPHYLRKDSVEEKKSYLRIYKKVLWIIFSIGSLFFLLFPPLGKLNDTLKIISQSKLVIGRGTNIFYDKNSFNGLKYLQNVIAFYNLCFIPLYCSRIKVPYVIYGQSFGPIHKSINKKLFRIIMNNAELILPRESLSQKYLVNEFLIEKEKIKVIPDSVFSLKKPSSEEIKNRVKRFNLNYKQIYVFIIRELMEKNNSELENLLNFYEMIFKGVQLTYSDLSCLILTQCAHAKQYNSFENDEHISDILYQRLKKINHHKVSLISELLTPDDIISILDHALFAVSVRLHSSIFSIIAGTPVFTVSYWGNKTKGIFYDLKLNEYVIEKDNLSSIIVIEKIKHLINDYETKSERINKINKEVHLESLRSPELINHLIFNSNDKFVKQSSN